MWKTWDVGLDWITATAKRDSANADILMDVALEHAARQMDEGQTAKPMTLLGYKGEQVGNIFYGTREDSAIARASGYEANNVATRLYEQQFRGNISRIDFQITAQSAEPEPNHARSIFNRLSGELQKGEKEKRYRFTYIDGGRAGSSLSIGSRTSTRYRRIYDKSAEQRHQIAPRLWRYETELKGDAARKAWALLGDTGVNGKIVTDVVTGDFELAGVPLSWIDHDNPQRLPSAHQITDDAKSLLWLQSAVRKRAQQLCFTQGRSAVISALGL
jgi:hypothetical protein